MTLVELLETGGTPRVPVVKVAVSVACGVLDHVIVVARRGVGVGDDDGLAADDGGREGQDDLCGGGVRSGGVDGEGGGGAGDAEAEAGGQSRVEGRGLARAGGHDEGLAEQEHDLVAVRADGGAGEAGRRGRDGGAVGDGGNAALAGGEGGDVSRPAASSMTLSSSLAEGSV